jgi:hypothetical protein
MARSGIASALSGAASYAGIPKSVSALFSKGAARSIVSNVNKMYGSGDYSSNQCSCNSLIKANISADAVFQQKRHSTRIVHHEYWQSITSQGVAAFTNTSYSINPGLVAIFPWLSTMASLYERYKINGLCLEGKSYGSQLTNTALGEVIIAMQYNVADSPFTTKATMENSDYSLNTNVTKDFIYGIECDPTLRTTEWLYTRGGSTTDPLPMCDIGDLNIATVLNSSYPAGTLLYDLSWSIDIEFTDPILTIPGIINYVHQQRNAAGVNQPLGNMVNVPLPTQPNITNTTTYFQQPATGTLSGITITNAPSVSTINLNAPPGRVIQVLMSWNFGGLELINGSGSPLGFGPGLQPVLSLDLDSGSQQADSIGNAFTSFTYSASCIVLTLQSGLQTITVPAPTVTVGWFGNVDIFCYDLGPTQNYGAGLI